MPPDENLPREAIRRMLENDLKILAEWEKTHPPDPVWEEISQDWEKVISGEDGE